MLVTVARDLSSDGGFTVSAFVLIRLKHLFFSSLSRGKKKIYSREIEISGNYFESKTNNYINIKMCFGL